MKKIELQNIEFSNMEAVEGIRLRNNYITSAHAFASLYVWKKEMKLELCLEEDLFSAKCGIRGNNDWFFPCGNDTSKKEFIARLLEQYSSKNGFDRLRLIYLRQEDVEFLNREFPGVFNTKELNDDSEYILEKEEFLALEGKKYQKLRHHIVQTERDYKIDIVPLNSKNREFAIEVAKTWKSHKNNMAWLEDDVAVSFFLNHLGDISARGILIYINGEPFSVSGGFPLSSDMYDLILCKQREPLGGLGTYAKYKFVESLPEHYKYINLEEDLGIMGLRDMKKRLRPHAMIDMYIGEEL